MTLSYLVKYSMTRSIRRSLCDSWASCNGFFQGCGCSKQYFYRENAMESKVKQI